MSETRRNYTAKFKSDLVIELLKGEKSINELAAESEIEPDLLREWKSEFLEKASLVFDDFRAEKAKAKLEAERRENAAYQRKVSQLTMQADWLERKSEELFGPDYESKFSKKPFED